MGGAIARRRVDPAMSKQPLERHPSKRMATLARFPEAKRRSANLSGRRHGRRHQAARLALEPLEVRWLPSTMGVQLPPAETINLADNLGALGWPVQTVQASGSIGNGPQGAADVAWYYFQLSKASQVDLTVRTPAGESPFASVLSLFNNDPNDFGDPYDLTGHRLMDQVQANPGTGTAQLEQNLSPGDYYVAISGAGNLDFSPVIAGSGFDGATGSYLLSVSATSLGLSNNGPTMIASDPAAGGVQNSSPLVIRVAMSHSLDPNTLNPGQDVQLLSLPAGGGPASPVALAEINFSADDELQLYPQAPLAPGKYEVLLLGNASGGGSVITGSNGVNLGEDPQNPLGANESFTFQIDGVDGITGATTSDNTAATAHQLGDITGSGLVRVTGAIGVDPSFNPGLSSDPMFPDPWHNPANQVDLYHFSVVGPGRFMLLADASAGLIGSPLDPGLSLWKLDPSTGQLDFVAGNNNTNNPTRATDGSTLLYTDSALSAGLTAGDYYIAVANGANTPSPLENQAPGSPGIFDPNQPGSAQNGWTTGPYVLDLLVAPAPAAPTVVESSPYYGQALGSAPTQINVQFSSPMDMQSLTFQPVSPEVYILNNATGTFYFPRLLNYDHTTNTATFQMLDGLPDGSYTLHLSGPAGLANLGGVPLVGNNQSGDYVIPFTVNGPAREITGSPSQGYTIASQYGGNVTQQIGVLFPDELAAGVTIVRAPESSPATPSPPEDRYAIQVLQNQNYSLSLSGSNLPAGIHVTVYNAQGQDVQLQPTFGPNDLAPLTAGSYTIVVSGWPAGQTTSISYDLTIKFFGGQENAPPLVDSPAPAIQIDLAGLTSSSSSPSATGTSSTGSTTTVTSDSSGMVPGPLSSGGGATASGTSGDSNDYLGVEGATTTGTSTGFTSTGLVLNDAVSGLAGLGMSPLGGSSSFLTTAVATGASSNATVQVVLGGPSTGSAALGRLALGLVTLTSIIPTTNHDGQDILPTDLPKSSTDTDKNPAADAPQARTPEENTPPAAVGPESERSPVVPASVPGSPSAHSGLPPFHQTVPTTPGNTTVAAVGGSIAPSNSAGAASKESAGSGDDLSKSITNRDRRGSRGRLARLLVVGAVATAAFRHRSAFRGLHWRKGAFSAWWRLDGASPSAPHSGRDSRAVRPASPAAATQCDSTIVVPGR